MKNLFISLLIALASITGNAQDTTTGKTAGQSHIDAYHSEPIVATVGTFTVKSTGEVLPVYRGSRGGLFCFRVSGKTGLPYKQYLKPEQVTMR